MKYVLNDEYEELRFTNAPWLLKDNAHSLWKHVADLKMKQDYGNVNLNQDESNTLIGKNSNKKNMCVEKSNKICMQI